MARPARAPRRRRGRRGLGRGPRDPRPLLRVGRRRLAAAPDPARRGRLDLGLPPRLLPLARSRAPREGGGRPLPGAARRLGRPGAAVVLPLLPGAGPHRLDPVDSVPHHPRQEDRPVHAVGPRRRGRVAGRGRGRVDRRPPARRVARRSRPSRPDVPQRPVGLVAAPQLLLRVAALVDVPAARRRRAVGGRDAVRAGVHAVLPVQGHRDPGHRGARARHPRRRLPPLPARGPDVLPPTAAPPCRGRSRDERAPRGDRHRPGRARPRPRSRSSARGIRRFLAAQLERADREGALTPAARAAFRDEDRRRPAGRSHRRRQSPALRGAPRVLRPLARAAHEVQQRPVVHRRRRPGRRRGRDAGARPASARASPTASASSSSAAAGARSRCGWPSVTRRRA